MKTLFKSKIALLLVVIGILVSCKNNQDGYSDEIETGHHADTVGTTPDSANTDANNSKGIDYKGNNTTTVTSGTDPHASSSGTGIGPGENTNDAATYSRTSGLQKDSLNSENKNSKKKTK